MPLRVLKWFFQGWVFTWVNLGLGLMVATAVGLWSGLESPWNYTLAAALGCFTVALLAYLAQRFQRRLPPPWGPTTGGGAAKVAVTARHGWRTDPAPDSPHIPKMSVPMDGKQDRAVDLMPGRRLRAVRVVKPVTKTVYARQLPKTLRWRLRRLVTVKAFVVGAMLVDEHLSGVDFEVELYYEDEA